MYIYIHIHKERKTDRKHVMIRSRAKERTNIETDKRDSEREGDMEKRREN